MLPQQQQQGLCPSQTKQAAGVSRALGNRSHHGHLPTGKISFKAAHPLKWEVRGPGLGNRLVCDAHSAIPEARGLYDPANDKDACGVGFVGELSKKESRRTVTDALKMLARMTHRGACGCEENTG